MGRGNIEPQERRRRALGGGWRILVLGLLAGTAVAVPAAATASDFEHPASNDPTQQFKPGSVQRQDTPNDPNYDQSEPDHNPAHGPSSTNFYDERFDLFGFPSLLSPNAIYRDGPHAGLPMVSGYNAAGAWKLERGRGDVTVAILDTGIRWNNTGLRDQIHLNTGELPLPEHSDGSTCVTYDCNFDGIVNVEDYAQDPRVTSLVTGSYPGREGPAGLVTGQDLIHAFGTCQIDPTTHTIIGGFPCAPGSHDNDGNGYANDIAGWNFFDNNNDPTDRSSYFAASNHGSGRAGDAAEQGNDGQGSIGTCPHCQIMPIRVWDTFVSDGNTFGLGITYAADNGVKVIEGADGSLYHSAFAEQASQYAYDRGAVQTFSGDDLNTGNHNYPSNYGHTMLIQGTVPDTVGLGQNAPGPPSGTPAPLAATITQLTNEFHSLGGGTNAPPGTYFRGANTTQYGGKSSISMEGATGSVNTGRASGAAGLVISAALDHPGGPIVLRPDETRDILEQTAERVTDANTLGAGNPDPGAPPSAMTPDTQWTTHFGWGRADVGAAVAVARSGLIPPEAAIDSPDWYAPLTGDSAQITGLARARFATNGAFHWKLMVGAGLAPTALRTVNQGDSTTSVTNFGTVDLNAVRALLTSTPVPPDPGGPVFAPTNNPYQQQFTVQLEVSSPGIPTTGIDRRVFTTFKDSTLRPGYPKRLGTGGEAPIRYADLNGDNRPELIVPTEDGTVHAYEPDGSELPGWPVHTVTQSAALGHLGSPALTAIGAPNEPPRGPVVADLDGSGRPDVITAAGIHIYAWHGDGTPVAGFPVSSNLAFCGPALEMQPLSHPKCGFLATPAVGRIEGPNRPLDIVAPSLDGHLYAFRPDGTPVPGYPIALIDPAQVANHTQMVAESINEPALGDLHHGDGTDDIVVATNEVYGAPAAGSDVSFSGALGSAAGASTRVYAVDGPTGHFLSGWPIALPGLIQNVLPFIGPGHDPAIAKVNGTTQILASATGGSLAEYNVDGTAARTIQQNDYSGGNAVDRSGSLNLFESASVGDLLGTGTPDVVKYHVTLNQAVNLLLVGQNQPYNHLIGAYDSTTGKSLPSFPTTTDDYQFLSSSDVARVTGGGPSNQVLAGTALGLLHAYDGATGLDTPNSGFPKQTGGWLFSPAAVSDDQRLADITREGYLFEWTDTAAPSCQPAGQWPSFRHDPQSSGNYDHDGMPPDAPSTLVLTNLGGGRYHLSFTGPGNNGPCGTPASYVASVDGHSVALNAPVPAGAQFTQDITLPDGSQTLAVQARDTPPPNTASNLGYPTTVSVPSTAGATNTGSNTSSGGSGSTAPGANVTGPLVGPGGILAAPTPAGNPQPSLKRCPSRRRLFIHVRVRRGERMIRAAVYVNGRRYVARRGRRLHAPVYLPTFSARRFTVTVFVRTSRGRLVRVTHTFPGCLRRSSRGG